MPWCEPCSRFLPTPRLGEDGACPTCGQPVTPASTAPRAPWHFKLLVASAAGYLLWRAVQGVAWLAGRL